MTLTYGSLFVLPLELSEANALVAQWHRHHQPCHIGGARVTYSRRAVERVLKWLDTEVTVPVSDDMGVWLGLHVVPVGVLRAAAAEMGQA